MADVEKTEFNLPAGKGPGRGGAHVGGRPTDSAIDANAQVGDNDLETNLRPKSLEEFIGQPKVRNQLDLVLTGARNRGVAPDHVLLSGPPGLGKTTMAMIIAQELGTSLRMTSGPALERAGDLAAMLSNLMEGDVLFIDEIHRIARPAEEMLYMEYYDVPDLTRVVTRAAKILNVSINHDAAEEIASRSRGTPRIANRLLRRVRDFAEVYSDGHVDLGAAKAALLLFDVDERGLDRLDRAVLNVLVKGHGGGPVGVSTLAIAVGEEPSTVEEVCEPYLVRAGMIARTGRGRVATAAAWRHVGLEPPEGTIGGYE